MLSRLSAIFAISLRQFDTKMKFKSYILSLTLLSAAAVGSAQNKPNTLFEYPDVPQNLTTLTERSNFYIENFWKRANLKSAFSSVARLDQAFGDYVDLMPYADANIVHKSINDLITQVAKDPHNLLTLAEIAEGKFYSDSARIACDECYLPFAQAVADSKKLSKAEKSRFAYKANILAHTQVGMIAPNFTYTTPAGETRQLDDLPKDAYVVLFVNDPDCDECELARVRLAADYVINDLQDRGLLKILSIYPGEISDEWKDRTSVYNKRWEVGAAPDIDEIYDLRHAPVIYYLNGQHKILSKSLTADQLIEAFRVVSEKMKANRQNTPAEAPKE